MVFFLLVQMHGYPDVLPPPPPGCRLPPPPPGHHDLVYGPPPPGMEMGVPPPQPPPDMDPSCSPEDWVRDPPPGTTDLYPRGPETEPEFAYLDTSDDSGRHTGPEPSSP